MNSIENMNRSKFLLEAAMLLKETGTVTHKENIYSADMVESIEIVCTNDSILVSGYELIDVNSKSHKRKMRGFRYNENCIENPLEPAMKHYQSVIASRYKERLQGVSVQKSISA